MADFGIVRSISGVVKAVAVDGAERILHVGDKVMLNEQIVTGDTGTILMEFSDGTLMDLGRNVSETLNDETLNPDTGTKQVGQALEEVQDEVEAIQQALLDGEILDLSELEATAAGGVTATGGTGEDDGHTIVSIDYLNPKQTPDSGFETKGINVSFPELQEELLLSPDENDTPTAGITTVLLDEDDIGSDQQAENYDALKTAFENDTGFDVGYLFVVGVNDVAEGDDLPINSPTTLSGKLVASFGNDGPGNIVFNPEATQPAGITSGGEPLQYWVSADGHSLVAYILTEQSDQHFYLKPDNGVEDTSEIIIEVAQIIFTAEITDVTAGTFRVALYGPVDHPDGTTEDNLLIDLGFTISDSNGDIAAGILALNVDDDSPVIDGEEGGEDREYSQTVMVDEDDIPGRGNTDVADGDDFSFPYLHLPIHFGADGPAEDDAVMLSPEGIVDQYGNALTSNDVELNYSWNSGGDVLIGYTSDINSPVLTITVNHVDQFGAGLKVDLFDNLDHPIADTEDNLIFNIGYTATDDDGDTVDGIFTVDVDDDMPWIRNMGEEPSEELINNGLEAKLYGIQHDGLQIIHDESAGRQPSLGDSDPAHDLFTFLFQNSPVDLIGVAVRPVESGFFVGQQGQEIYNLAGVHYNGGADGIANIALTDTNGVALSGQDSGLKTTQGGHTIYLYTIPNSLLAEINGGASPEQFASYADNFVVGLTREGLDLTDLDSLEDIYDSLPDILTDIAFVVGLVEDVPVYDSQGSEDYDSHDDVIALLQLKAIEHGDTSSHDELISTNLIHITVTDGDDDSVTSEAIRVSFDDDGPSIPGFVTKHGDHVDNQKVVADEDDLVDGIGDTVSPGDDDPKHLTGTLSHEYGADRAGSIDFAKMDGETANFESNGNEVIYRWDAGAGILFAVADGGAVVFTVEIDTVTGDYEFKLQDNVDHRESHGNQDDTENPNVNMQLTYTVTDGDGDTVDGKLRVSIDDDMPVISAHEVQLLQESFENFREGNGWHVEGEGGATIVGDHGVVWTVNEAGIEIQKGNVGGSTASDGDSHAELDAHDLKGDGGTTLTVLSTQIDIPAGEATLSFDYKPRPADPAGSDMKVTFAGKEIILDGQADGSVVISPSVGVSVIQTTSSTGWISVTLGFVGLAASEATLSFEGLPDAGGGNGANTLGAYLDNINLMANSLQVDETTLNINDTADFSGQFAGDFGADGPGDMTFGLTLSPGNTGVNDTVTGEKVFLFLRSDGVVEGRTETSDELVFTVSVDNAGVVTLDQIRAVIHTDENDHDSVVGLNAGVVNLEATITDFDGDSVSTSIDLGVAISFRDDGPTIMVEEEHTDVSYKFTITNHDEVSSAGYHNSYGYYVKDGGGNPASGVVVWDDVHDNDTAPVTVTGYTPDQIGFFIIPNGDNRNGSLEDNTEVIFRYVDNVGNEVDFASGNGQWQAYLGTTPLVGNGSHVLFDVAKLNIDGQDHVEDNGLIGNQNWEDLQIPAGDEDFNDVNINVEWMEVTATSDVLGVSFGADGPGSIDFTLGVTTSEPLLSNGKEVGFIMRDTDADGHADQLVGKTEDGDVLTIDGVLDSDDYELNLLGPIDKESADVDITANVQVFDGDGDFATAILNFHIDVNTFLDDSSVDSSAIVL